MSVNKGRFELASYQSSPVFMEGNEIGAMQNWKSLPIERLMLAFTVAKAVEISWKEALLKPGDEKSSAKRVVSLIDKGLAIMFTPQRGAKKPSDTQRRELFESWIRRIGEERDLLPIEAARQ